MSKKILLIDGNSIINRAFYAIPMLTNKDGEYTNGIYGFLNILLRFVDEEKPDYLGIAFDLPAPTFRHIQFKEYKGTRKSMPEELRPQIPALKNLLQKMHLCLFEMEGFEADDILGTLAQKGAAEGFDVTIVSGDRDLLQLATDTIKIKIPKTKGGKTEVESYTDKEVLEKLGVTPVEYIDVKALMGDASDNIPGVPSIGEKTATKIIQEYQTVENAIEHAQEIKPKKASENLIAYTEQALLSKALATICTTVPVVLEPEAMTYDEMVNPDSYEEIKRLEFKSILNRFSTAQVQKTEKQPTAFRYLDDSKEIQSYVQSLLKENLVAYTFILQDNTPIGISFCCGEGQGAMMSLDSLSLHQRLATCAPFFQSQVQKIALNSKFDKVFLHHYNIDVQHVIFDAMLAGYIVNASKTSYDFDDIAMDFLNEPLEGAELFFGKGKNRKSLESISTEAFRDFACKQSEVIFRAYPVMRNIILENGQEALYYEMELPLVDVLKDMEIWGIKVNRTALMAYRDELDGVLQGLTEEIYQLSGESFNINSPQQLGIILFEKLGLKSGKKTKTGYSTSHDVLEKLQSEHEIVAKILEYRTLAKLKSTYADGLLNVLNGQDDKIYTTFNQLVTTTGRISSTEPNLQNIPIRMEVGRALRKVFIPSDSEYVFLDADYSQIELRVLAHIAQDETMMEAFREGEDIHRLTASQVLKIPMDEVTAAQRSNAKAVNFGIVYGISAFSLSQDLKISKKEADVYIQQYFEKYPKIKGYLDTCIEEATENGYAKTIFARRRSIPELSSSNFVQKGFGQRVAMNMPIQGTAADIIKMAMIKVHEQIVAQKLNARLILQVHDELLLEVHRDEIEKVKTMVQHEMENAVALGVPLETDIHIGENWYEAK